MSDLETYDAQHENVNGYLNHRHLGNTLFWLVILTVVIFMFLVFFKPEFVLRKKDCEVTDEVDLMRALLSAVGLALLVSFVLLVLRYLVYC